MFEGKGFGKGGCKGPLPVRAPFRPGGRPQMVPPGGACGGMMPKFGGKPDIVRPTGLQQPDGFGGCCGPDGSTKGGGKGGGFGGKGPAMGMPKAPMFGMGGSKGGKMGGGGAMEDDVDRHMGGGPDGAPAANAAGAAGIVPGAGRGGSCAAPPGMPGGAPLMPPPVAPGPVSPGALTQSQVRPGIMPVPSLSVLQPTMLSTGLPPLAPGGSPVLGGVPADLGLSPGSALASFGGASGGLPGLCGMPLPVALPPPPPGGSGGRNKNAWPVFVGNIAFDTEEEEVASLFRDCRGLKSFRLAAKDREGSSRGFGFAEFDDPASALDAIKTIDGTDIRGRRLRLRWGENANTTPEVDEFHRAPERWKTRPCTEAFKKGDTCPRGDDCPYAHSNDELRRLGDKQADGPAAALAAVTTALAAKTPEIIKVPIPINEFPGEADEEKSRAAYLAVLGTGASNIRGMMKKTGCRLQLRGLGDRAPGKPAEEEKKEVQEPLHLVIRPGTDGKAVSDDNIQLIKRTVGDIISEAIEASRHQQQQQAAQQQANQLALGDAAAEGGTGAEVQATAGSAANPAGVAAAAAPPVMAPPAMAPPPGEPPAASAGAAPRRNGCALGAMCPDMECTLAHPRLPGQTPAPVESAVIKYFVMTSKSIGAIQTSVRNSAWATSWTNTRAMDTAFEKADHAVLFFSAANTGHFQGYARMNSAPDSHLFPELFGRKSSSVEVSLGHSFKVSWLKRCMLPFSQTDNLRTGLDFALRDARDGQEVPAALGEKLVRLLYQQKDVDLLSLPADDDDDDIDALKTVSRQASRSRSRGGGQARGRSESGSARRRQDRRGRRGGGRNKRRASRSLDRDRGRFGGSGGPGAWVPPGTSDASAGGAAWTPPTGAPPAGAWQPPPAEAPREAAAGDAQDDAPAWSKKPASAWTVPGSAPAADPGLASPPPGHAPPPGWPAPFGAHPPAWGHFPPPGPFGFPPPGHPMAGPPPGWHPGMPMAPPEGWRPPQ